MKILMIGNGFDLEHGLPTKYRNFLDFTEKFQSLVIDPSPQVYNKNASWDDICICDYLMQLLTDVNKNNIKDELLTLIKDNYWLEYFYKSQNYMKENWIDFESEISKVVKALEKASKFYYSSMEKDILGVIVPSYLKEILEKCDIHLIKEDNSLNEEILVSFKKRITLDLNKLIRALEIYLWDFCESIPIKYYNPDIQEIHPDKVISFNYTNIYSKIYATDIDNIEYDYIHGLADINNTIDTNKMVLGIDEYLDDSCRNNEIAFIAFKKYFQRIHKMTGCVYKEWVEEIEKTIQNNVKEDHELYIFGHSLDVTDKDILSELLKNDNINTTIFYYDQKVYGTLIGNLVKVIKSEELIKRVYGKNKSIVFKKQRNRNEIKGSAFEADLDRCKLNRFFCYTNKEIQQLFNKIDKKINEKDLSYFHTQDNVIDLFNVLAKSNLEINYKSKLLDIAKNLLYIEDSNTKIFHNYKKWNIHDISGEHNCLPEVTNFIQNVNLYNTDIYNAYISSQFYKETLYILKSISLKKKLFESQFKEALDIFLKEFEDEECDVKELWKTFFDIMNIEKSDVIKICINNKMEEETNMIKKARLIHLKECYEENEYILSHYPTVYKEKD